MHTPEPAAPDPPDDPSPSADSDCAGESSRSQRHLGVDQVLGTTHSPFRPLALALHEKDREFFLRAILEQRGSPTDADCSNTAQGTQRAKPPSGSSADGGGDIHQQPRWVAGMGGVEPGEEDTLRPESLSMPEDGYAYSGTVEGVVKPSDGRDKAKWPTKSDDQSEWGLPPLHDASASSTRPETRDCGPITATDSASGAPSTPKEDEPSISPRRVEYRHKGTSASIDEEDQVSP